jgi:hypothetical protein
MEREEGRAPRPRRGDPNTKSVDLHLETEEWRRLRAWSAQESRSVEEVIERALRAALEARPRIDY